VRCPRIEYQSLPPLVQATQQPADLASPLAPGLAQRLARCCRGDVADDGVSMGKPHSKHSRPVVTQDSWQRRAPMPPTASDKAAADGLRVEGNALFAKGKYGAALEVRAPPSCAS